jgi:hypothetical protein
MEWPHSPQWRSIIFIQRHLGVTEYGLRCHLAFPLAGAEVGACTTLVTGYVYPSDLDATGLITLLLHNDADIVQRGQLPQLPHPYCLV